jgi:hypothetical protein
MFLIINFLDRLGLRLGDSNWLSDWLSDWLRDRDLRDRDLRLWNSDLFGVRGWWAVTSSHLY